MPKYNDRKDREAQEGYKTVDTDLPSQRFQGKKQVLKPDEVGVTESSIPSTVSESPSVTAAKTLKSKTKVQPEASIEELEDKQVGGVPLTYAQSVRSVAGVTNQSPADDTSKVPYSPGNYRPTTRYAKKRSEDLFELDQTCSEQIVPLVDDLADLKDDPEGGIGYNGRRQFKQTRGKKNFGYTNASGHALPRLPQQLLNAVSADEYTDSQIVYTSGQMLDGIDCQADYPTQDHDGSTIPCATQKSNYRALNLRITVTDNHITDVKFDEEKYIPNTDPLTRDQANFNWQIDGNNVAKSMIKIQTEMGRETTDKWTPLAYVINQPYEYNMLMHDIEATTGAYMAAAYRAAVASLAYQRNITKKDGVNPQFNAFKMIYEGYAGTLTNDDGDFINDLNFEHVIFNDAEYRKGSAAGLIAMFDSTRKYRTKADLLGMQRSFGLHLAQMDNNLNPLRVKPNFIKTLDRAHKFSTYSGSYNAMTLYYTTQRIGLVTPLSLNRFLLGWTNPALANSALMANPRYDASTGTYASYTYRYRDLRNNYLTRVQMPLIEGILRWLLKHEGAFVSTFTPSGSGEVVMPTTFNFKSPTLFQFLLCSAAQDVLWERNICFRDILFAGEQSTYIWGDLASLGDLNPLASSQLTIGRYDEPLKMGTLTDDSKARIMYNEHIQVTDTSSRYVQYAMPWTFNEVAFGNTAGGVYTQNEGFFVEERAFQMSFPSIRDDIRHVYVDLAKDLGPDAMRLALDRRLTLPLFRDLTATEEVAAANVVNGNARCVLYAVFKNTLTSSVNTERIELSTLRYDPNSDGRIVAKYDITGGSNRHLPPQMIYCIPKELGLIDDDFSPETLVVSATYSARDGLTPVYYTNDFSMMYGAGNDAPVYDGGRPVHITSYRVQADSASDGSIDRSAALTQVFYRCFACADANATNENFVERTGLVLSHGFNDAAPVDVYGVYNLGSNGESTHALDVQVRTNSQFIWTMLQRIFFPVNPFANCFTFNNDVHAYDPMEECFYFGVCGFLAADNTQNVLERLDQFDQLGMDYTEDVYQKKSLILR